MALLTLADPAETGTAAGSRPRLPPSSRELHLLLEWPNRRSQRSWAAIFSASLALHLLLFAVVVRLPAPAYPVEEHPVVFHSIILYTPPSLMTQKAPNRHPVSKQIDLADLLARQASQARRAAAPPTRRRFQVPNQTPTSRAQVKQAPVLPNAPQIAVNHVPVAPQPGLPNSPLHTPPKPAAPPNPFQDIGMEARLTGPPKIVPPSSSVQAEIGDLMRHPRNGPLVISDDNHSQPLPGSPLSPWVNGGPHSAVELQSDPRGADFRPYLAKILAIVRANWRRVIPESARMGQLRGRTVIEFIINRDGSIPKLVTTESSGSDPLDRAAVAGLSMSNPLPPLPADFKGFQVRLAFTFAYNQPSQ